MCLGADQNQGTHLVVCFYLTHNLIFFMLATAKSNGLSPTITKKEK